MNAYDVYANGKNMGVFHAYSPQRAILECYRDAGYYNDTVDLDDDGCFHVRPDMSEMIKPHECYARLTKEERIALDVGCIKALLSAHRIAQDKLIEAEKNLGRVAREVAEAEDRASEMRRHSNPSTAPSVLLARLRLEKAKVEHCEAVDAVSRSAYDFNVAEGDYENLLATLAE